MTNMKQDAFEGSLARPKLQTRWTTSSKAQQDGSCQPEHLQNSSLFSNACTLLVNIKWNVYVMNKMNPNGGGGAIV